MLPKEFIISSTKADGQIDQVLLCVTGSTELEAKLSEALFLGTSSMSTPYKKQIRTCILFAAHTY